MYGHMHVLGAHGSQKKASNTLELELRLVVSHLVGVGIKLGYSARATNALITRAISPVPLFLFFNKIKIFIIHFYAVVINFIFQFIAAHRKWIVFVY